MFMEKHIAPSSRFLACPHAEPVPHSARKTQSVHVHVSLTQEQPLFCKRYRGSQEVISPGKEEAEGASPVMGQVSVCLRLMRTCARAPPTVEWDLRSTLRQRDPISRVELEKRTTCMAEPHFILPKGKCGDVI